MEYCQMKEEYMLICLPQELDHHLAERIRKEADALIMESHVNTVIVDFAQTEFMDSSGIGLLMGRYHLLHKWNGRICVAGLSDGMQRIYRMSGLLSLIPQYRDVDAAMHVLKGGKGL